MFEERDLKLDLAAIALLAFAVFLGLSLGTYNRADPIGSATSPVDGWYEPDTLVYPVADEISNLCGHWGAYASDLLLNGLGIGAYYLVISLGVLDVLLLMRRQIDAPLLRSVGWIASLMGLTTLAAMLVPGLSPGPVIGAGGYLGALGEGVLKAHFAMAGALILALSMICGGLLLCTDYILLRIGYHSARITLRSACGAFVATRVGGHKRKDSADDQIEEEEEEAEEEQSVPIRIRGRHMEEVEEDLEEDAEEAEGAEPESDELEEEYEGEEDEEYEIGEEEHEEIKQPRRSMAAVGRESSTKSFRGRLAQTLRIKGPQETSREQVMEELEAASQNGEPENYELPSMDLLLESDQLCFDEHEKEVRRKAKVLEKTFANFGFMVKVVEVETGPVIAQYEVQLEAGLRLSRITGLADDLAIALRVPSVRIVAPIPGKNTVGIEVPNQQRQLVRLREVMEEMNGKIRKMRIPMFLGKDVSGSPMVVDLSTLPHLLIAGRTGTGKSVCLNAIIASILMTRRPDEVRMLMIDPKMVELSCYKTLPHLMHPVVTDMRKAEAILAWAVEKMEERYELLARAGVRHVSVYNQLGEEELMERLEPESEEERAAIPMHLPYIVIVADEMADLMMTAGKEVEQHIIRLAQKSRAVGIHLILATQKPTVDVITGLIKSNLPARIAFQVASRTDSRVVLDEMGADKLLGNGDMLFLWPGTSTLLRGQGTFLSDDEIDGLVDFVSTGEQHFVKELVHLKVEESGESQPGELKKRDDLYEAAVDVVVSERRGSVSLLQRTLGVGYGRAARLIDFMAEDGIVGAYAGSQAREVLISPEEWLQMQGHAAEPAADPAKRSRTSNIVMLVDKTADQHGVTTGSFGDKPAEQQFDDEEESYEEEQLVEDDDEPTDEYEEKEGEIYDEQQDETDEYDDEEEEPSLEDDEADEYEEEEEEIYDEQQDETDEYDDEEEEPLLEDDEEEAVDEDEYDDEEYQAESA